MGDVQQQNSATSAHLGAASVTVAALHSAARAANKVDSNSISPNVVKGGGCRVNLLCTNVYCLCDGVVSHEVVEIKLCANGSRRWNARLFGLT